MVCIAGRGRLVDVGPWVVMAAELGGKVGWKMDHKKKAPTLLKKRDRQMSWACSGPDPQHCEQLVNLLQFGVWRLYRALFSCLPRYSSLLQSGI
ncbi:hypothetical protein FJTKL_00019 [Diaporthe vaccinii]|uniref:Uncharacterized protein n=1 Tax=Diaporthe vaccinii TaxID=105482 RepID=A0ABR4E4T0_9PEZI